LASKIIINNYVRLFALYEESALPGLYIGTEKLNIIDLIQLVLFFMDWVKMVRLIDALY